MENIGKRLQITVPKWVKIYLPKLFAQAQKFGILMKKASFASIVSDHKQAGLEW